MNKALAIILGASLLSGIAACGKVSKGPISPLIDPPVVYTFDANDEGWIIREQKPLTGMAISHSTERALGSAGSLRLDLNFNAKDDKLVTGATLAPAKDMRGKTMSTWVYWDTGLAQGGGKLGAQLFAMDSSNHWSNGTFATLTLGSWTQVTFNMDSPSYNDGTDMSDVLNVGIQIVADAGLFVPGVVYVDQFGF